MYSHSSQPKKQPASRGPSSSPGPGRILLGEDDNEMRSLLAGELHREGYEVVECRNGIQLLDRLYSFLLPHGREDYHLIISDIRMPGLTGLEILAGLADKPGFPPTILITAFGDDETHAEAERYHVVAVFDKPFDLEDLLAKVREIVPPGEHAQN